MLTTQSLGPTRHKLLIIVIASFILSCLAAVLQSRFNWSLHYVPSFGRATQGSTYAYTNFGNALFEALENHPPGTTQLEKPAYRAGLIFWRATQDTPRPDVIHMNTTSVTAMRQAHEDYLRTVQQLTVPFRPGTSGIVSTAGDIYLPVFIISLRMLRRTGCQLPVELFLQSRDEHGSYLCDALLPSLNARCVHLDDILGPRATTIAKFQLKVFSMLFSSFENVLFLDADNFLVHDPTNLFAQDPFRSSGLVTWPDFWASSASKHFYEIIGHPVPAMNALPSSESGQLLVSKASHGPALMAAAYYNFYGPDYFYALMTQDGPGGGDKETFVAGAQAVGAPFHQVEHHVDTIGYYEQGHERYHGVAMVQYDPTTSDAASPSSQNNTPRPFAVHHNYPKFDPVELFSADGAATDHTTGKGHRLLGDRNLTMQRFGRDVERELWAEIEYVACTLGEKFRHWRTVPSTSERNGTCDQVKEYRATVFGGS
ncbi:mannosyltransferase [Exophiala xenobiotica]|uniref:Mannosyltransferase n=1 Tax=Lithohypha guttulata TaxID=1690604 RepID=A0ABR0KAR1_9EURO|nr:mannosyltransferase [Lithohypha guttulata]KAK5318802.1 mannosyltransferase [Exophiala xenobiotica]